MVTMRSRLPLIALILGAGCRCACGCEDRVELPVPLIGQTTSLWCWAASAEMTAISFNAAAGWREKRPRTDPSASLDRCR